MAKIIKLIYSEERAGLGTKDDPLRLCPQLWTLDGTLVAARDPMPKDNPAHPVSWFEPLGKML